MLDIYFDFLDFVIKSVNGFFVWEFRMMLLLKSLVILVYLLELK